MDRLALGCLVAAIALAGCAGGSSRPGAPLAIDVAAVTYQGVADAVWDVRVENDASPPETVFAVRLAASRYGAGASASYVGTCDAQAGGSVDASGRWSAPNRVRVRLLGIYPTALGGDLGQPGDPAPAGSLAFTDPGELAQIVTCTENADVRVSFDVTILRPATQGFFDIAVEFHDIFCSAKYDCGGSPPGTLAALLHDATGQRARANVLGFACTAGPGVDVTTALWFSDVRVTCTGSAPSTSVIDPLSGPGNLCSPGAADSSIAPSACVAPSALPAAGPLFQAAVYRGVERLPDLSKLYLDVALGIEDAVPPGTTCALSFEATADDSSDARIPGGVIAAGQVYPYIQVAVPDVATCAGPHAINADGVVVTRYTETDGPAKSFPHVYGDGIVVPPPPPPHQPARADDAGRHEPPLRRQRRHAAYLRPPPRRRRPRRHRRPSGHHRAADPRQRHHCASPTPPARPPTPPSPSRRRRSSSPRRARARGRHEPRLQRQRQRAAYAFDTASSLGGGNADGDTCTAPPIPGSAIVRVTDAAGQSAAAAVTITAVANSSSRRRAVPEAGTAHTFGAGGRAPPYTFVVASGTGGPRRHRRRSDLHPRRPSPAARPSA
ncbi:MAG: hypothetical protein U1F43_32490 [Myxococcota bacterium]